MIIDAHQHFWRLGENDCLWPTPDLSAIYRDATPRQLEAIAAPLGVSASVLVQSQQSSRDTDWLLALAAQTVFVKAVVGWADLKSPDAPARIAALAAHPKMRGLRPMLQSLPDDAWIADPMLDPAVEAMIAHGLSFDALVFTRHLSHLRAFAERHPRLAIVIDHGAKPEIKRNILEPWRSEMAAIAKLPNVWCKLSGLMTEAEPGQGSGAFQPYVDHLLDMFGPARLMWGSDWPVLGLAGHYAQWLDLARRLCGDDPAVRKAVFADTASAFYRI